MFLVNPDLIADIDNYAEEKLGILHLELMSRAGRAVADAVRKYTDKGASVSVFAGKGNNGGDGYAAATYLMHDYDVTVYDVFSAGQRSTEGKYFLQKYIADGGKLSSLELNSKTLSEIRASACIVDAVFGTGFLGELPKIAVDLSDLFSQLEDAVKIAVDVPLGIDAALGRLLLPNPYCATATVELGFVKAGIVSYPARKYVGKLIYDNIGLHNDEILRRFNINDGYVDYELAASLLPERASDSHKGSFGRLLMIAGSATYPGAAHLALEAALRSGVGYVTCLGEKALCDSLLLKFPEVIYKHFSLENMSDAALDDIVKIAEKHTAVMIGSGLGSSHYVEVFKIIERLLSCDGGAVIIDADGINALSLNPKRATEILQASKRKVILTPHPLELSRIAELPTESIQADRLGTARAFASSRKVILVLKGAGTITTDGKRVFINSSGSSALAKAGSGDVLAGLISGIAASGTEPLVASALATYLHGLAADRLADELSELGVTPSDLPIRIAREMAELSKNKNKR